MISRFCFPYFSSQTDHIEKDALTTLMALLPDFTGRIFGHNLDGRDSIFCYELMLETSALTATQIELITKYNNNSHIFPVFTSMFATTITNNHYENIIDAWNSLYNEWMLHSMFQQSDLSSFEEYLTKQGILSKKHVISG